MVLAKAFMLLEQQVLYFFFPPKFCLAIHSGMMLNSFGMIYETWAVSKCLKTSVLVVISTFHSLMVIISLSSLQPLKTKIFQCYPWVFFTSFIILLGVAGKYSYVIVAFCLRVNEIMALCIGFISNWKQSFDKSVLFLLGERDRVKPPTKCICLHCYNGIFYLLLFQHKIFLKAWVWYNPSRGTRGMV